MEPGAVIGAKYHVVQLVGQGGMGAVYDAVNATTGRRVALKLIKEQGIAAGSASRQRFAREVKAAGGIDSLHVVQVLDAGEDDVTAMPYLVMEYLQGEDLRAVLSRGPLSIEQALTIAVQACRGLVKAHAADVIHRDLKPANLFLAEVDGGQRIVKILDFGIAKVLHDESVSHELTTTGDLVGSPPYMSPEQLSSPRDLDQRTDVWSLGVVLYEMITGKLPHARNGPIGALVHAICHTPAPSLAALVPTAPPGLVALVERALAIDRTVRFASSEELLEALCALQSEPAHPRDNLGAPGTRASSPPASPLSAAAPLELSMTERDPPRTRLGKRARWGAFVAAAVFTVSAALLARRFVGAPSSDSRASPSAAPFDESSASVPAPSIPSITPPEASSEAPPLAASSASSKPPAHGAHPVSSGARKSGVRRAKSEGSAAPGQAPPATSGTSTGREQL